jgi:hypothetical protein
VRQLGPFIVEIPDRAKVRQAWRKVETKRFPKRGPGRWRRFIVWATDALLAAKGGGR